MKKNKLIDGQRLTLVISEDCKKILNTKLKEQKGQLTITSYIESLILRDKNTQKDIDKVFSLALLNKDLYFSTNATFSNLNQIAHGLNLAKIFDIDNIKNDKERLTRLLNALEESNHNVKQLRLLTLEMLLTLQSGGERRQIKKRLKELTDKEKEEKK